MPLILLYDLWCLILNECLIVLFNIPYENFVIYIFYNKKLKFVYLLITSWSLQYST